MVQKLSHFYKEIEQVKDQLKSSIKRETNRYISYLL